MGGGGGGGREGGGRSGLRVYTRFMCREGVLVHSESVSWEVASTIVLEFCVDAGD